MPADRIVASVRDPAKATELAKKGVHVSSTSWVKRHFNCTVLPSRPHAPPARDACSTPATWAHGWTPFLPGHDHAATEAYLAEGGAPFTSLRPGFYAESALHLIRNGLQIGEIPSE